MARSRPSTLAPGLMLFSPLLQHAPARGACTQSRADEASAKRARETIRDADLASVITVIEGLSTAVTLPEKVDVCISETVGSIASEEGLYPTMADAHLRHVLRPTEEASWIPRRIQTRAAPACYALHHGVGHPAFAWLETSAAGGPPRPEMDDGA